AFDLARGRGAEPMLGGYANAGRQATLEGGADHALRLAVAVGRRHVKERDAAIDRGTHRRDAFIARGRSPQLADPTAHKGERAPRPEPAKCTGLHGRSSKGWMRQFWHIA